MSLVIEPFQGSGNIFTPPIPGCAARPRALRRNPFGVLNNLFAAIPGCAARPRALRLNPFGVLENLFAAIPGCAARPRALRLNPFGVLNNLFAAIPGCATRPRALRLNPFGVLERSGALSIVLLATASAALADPKAAKPDESPKIVVAIPPAVLTGAATRLTLRGQKLDGVTEVRCQPAAAKVKLLSKGTADDIAGVGKTQAEIEVTLPADFADSTVTVSLVSAAGASNAHRLLVDRTPILAEKEPNNGFAEAGAIAVGQTVAGAIQRGFDVDVYRFQGKAGQRIQAEVLAARLGSPLDSLLTLYSSDGQLLAANDDLDDTTTDSRIEVALPRDGIYYVAVVDANDHGSPAHVYRLSLREKR
jgi:Bacterial pre-peptidase C-terminal domain